MNTLNSINFVSLFTPDNIFRWLVVYFFIVWFCLVVWVVKDITNRTNNIYYQTLCILLILLFTPLGLFIYILIRPQKTLFERIFESEFYKFEQEYEKVLK